MARTTPWPWWHKGDGPDDHRQRELLRAIWDLHAVSSNVWLWRGQANCAYPLCPAIHTRVQLHGALDDDAVLTATGTLLEAVRHARLDVHEGVCLTDLPLLALLQHHGAATPLLDVSLDPMVGLYMAVVSPNPADEEKDGVLLAIRRPAPAGQPIPSFTSNLFATTYADLPVDAVRLYNAPDVSDRLSIQRGHFLLGRVAVSDRATIPLSVEGRDVVLADTWLSKILSRRGRQGPIPSPTTDVAAFRVTAKFKQSLKAWLEDRTGLDYEFIYPPAWHQPYLDAFCKSHGRTSP